MVTIRQGAGLWVCLVFSYLAFATPLAEASSYIMISDSDLEAQAHAIVEVQILRSSVGSYRGLPSTEYVARVLRILKGPARARTVIVRVEGGLAPDGRELWVPGSPSFADGDRALLFLLRNSDRSYSILHGLLGAFLLEARDGRLVASRSMAGANVIVPGADAEPGPAGVEALPGLLRPDALERSFMGALPVIEWALRRDYPRFARWLAGQVRGRPRTADYFLPARPADLRRGKSPDDERWFLWDNLPGVGVVPVEWFLDCTDAPSYCSDDEFEKKIIRHAIKFWDQQNSSSIRYKSDGPSASRDRVRWDPGKEIPGSLKRSKCEGGRVTLVRVFTENPMGELQCGSPPQSFREILRAEVVVNDGFETCREVTNKRPEPALTLKQVQELFESEFSVTLGLGSDVKEAVRLAPGRYHPTLGCGRQ